MAEWQWRGWKKREPENTGGGMLTLVVFDWHLNIVCLKLSYNFVNISALIK